MHLLRRNCLCIAKRPVVQAVVDDITQFKKLGLSMAALLSSSNSAAQICPPPTHIWRGDTLVKYFALDAAPHSKSKLNNSTSSVALAAPRAVNPLLLGASKSITLSIMNLAMSALPQAQTATNASVLKDRTMLQALLQHFYATLRCSSCI